MVPICLCTYDPLLRDNMSEKSGKPQAGTPAQTGDLHPRLEDLPERWEELFDLIGKEQDLNRLRILVLQLYELLERRQLRLTGGTPAD